MQSVFNIKFQIKVLSIYWMIKKLLLRLLGYEKITTEQLLLQFKY